MAVAARLAKLGHQVTVLERGPRLGGALVPVERDGFEWDGGPAYTLLPAVLRDLFRKSGRPLERELELVELDVLREHRFADGSSVRLPYGSRAAQIQAVDGLGPGLGRRWAEHVQAYADDWEVLRREYLERPWDPAHLPAPLADRLRSRETLAKRVRRLKDERLAQLALYPAVAEGHDPRDVPAWAGVTAYVEQRFGAWAFTGGMAALAEALANRLATRKVEVRTSIEVRDLVVRGGRVAAVTTDAGDVDADVVVVACDPRRLPTLAPLVRRTMPALPPVVVHLGLEGDLPDLAHETVLHGSATQPQITVRTAGTAWTLLGRGRVDEDLATALVRRRIDIRAQVVTRVDRSPRELVEDWGGSPCGVLWQGRQTTFRRLGPATPIAGVYAAGAHATPGAGLPFVGLSAALVAQLVGPA
jgi:UDP-galactopyranose mutase